MEFPLINGTAYSWANIRVEILGVPVTGIKAIEYGEKENKQNNYGAGRYPVSRGYGNVEPSASITLHKDTVNALQAVAPNNRIQDIPKFDVTVAYVADGKYTMDVIRNMEFTDDITNVNQGDMEIVQKIECICSHIDRG